MFNKQAISDLKSYLNQEDYNLVELKKEEYNFIYTKCAEIQKLSEENIYNEVEVILNSFLFDLGYVWNENTFKYELPLQ